MMRFRLVLITLAIVSGAVCMPAHADEVVRVRICPIGVGFDPVATDISFFAVFKIDVGLDGRIEKTVPVGGGPQVSEPDLLSCTKDWTLSTFSGLKGVGLSLRWERGSGWKEVTVSAPGKLVSIGVDQGVMPKPNK